MTEPLMPWLSLLIFAPLAGALTLALVPDEHRDAHRAVGIFFASLTLLFFLPVLAGFDATAAGFQLTHAAENAVWIAPIGARYHVAVDGVSLWLVGLTAVLGLVAATAGVTSVQDRTRAYYAALLTLLTAVLGALCAVDLLLFAFFWELMLVPLAIVLAVSGRQHRAQAAMRLFIITLVASMPLLAGIFYVWAAGGGTSFDWADMAATARGLGAEQQQWLLLAFCAAFFVKLPLVPLHTWLPEAHAQTSTAGSVVLGAIVFNAGTYGLFRFALPFFPDAVYWAAPGIGLLSTLAIVYGATIACSQTDIKRMIAYSSISHLGFITLGLFALNLVGATGALVQALAHGVTAGALFLVTGVLIDRHDTQQLQGFGGLARRMPVFAVLFVFTVLAYAGVPGLIGFVGEFLVLAGTAGSWAFALTPEQAHLGGLSTGPDAAALVLAGLAGLRVILGAIYLLWLVRKVVLGPETATPAGPVRDIRWAEAVPLVPMVILSLWVGLQPGYFTSRTEASLTALLSDVAQEARAAAGTASQIANQHRSTEDWFTAGRGKPWAIQSQHTAPHAGEPQGEHP